MISWEELKTEDAFFVSYVQPFAILKASSLPALRSGRQAGQSLWVNKMIYALLLC